MIPMIPFRPDWEKISFFVVVLVALVAVIWLNGCGCPQKYAHDDTSLHWVESKCSNGETHFIRWVDAPHAATETH